MSSLSRPASSNDSVSHEKPKTLNEIEAAIRHLEVALTSAANGETHHPAFQAVHHDRLADLYFSKHAITGNSDDLNAVEYQGNVASVLGRQAMQRTPPGYSKAAQWCALQGSRLTLRYERFGDRKDLDEAIDVYNEALSSLTEESTLRSVILMNQANCLCTRYEADGTSEDIVGAIEKAKNSLAAAGENAVAVQNDLSTMYLSKYEKEGKVGDLEQAIGLAKKAVDGTEENDPRLPTRLLNLANGLNAKYERNEKFQHIHETVQVLQDAEHAARLCNAECMLPILSHLAHAFYVRYTWDRESSDLFAAKTKAEEALEMTGEVREGSVHLDIHNSLTKLLYTCSEEARDFEEDEEVYVEDISVQA